MNKTVNYLFDESVLLVELLLVLNLRLDLVQVPGGQLRLVNARERLTLRVHLLLPLANAVDEHVGDALVLVIRQLDTRLLLRPTSRILLVARLHGRGL